MQTESNQPLERLLPIDVEMMEQVMITMLKHKFEPVEAVYMHPTGFEKLIKGSLNQPYPEYLTVNGFSVFSDPIVTPGIFFLCEPGLFEIYKSLKTSPYVDKNWNDSQLQKIATGLWEQAKKERDKPKIEWLFTEGEKFPTGAKFTPKIPIDFIDIKGQKF